MRLNVVDEHIWEVSDPLQILGVEFGHRMTVVKLSSGDLWVHSPIALNEAVQKELGSLGTPQYFVAPSAFHDMYWKPYFEKFDNVEFHGVSGMPAGLTFTHTFSETIPNAWAKDFDMIAIEGIPMLNEHVFVHKKTKTLILADLVFNFDTRQKLWERMFLSMNGVHGKIGPSRMFRACIKDKKAFRGSLDRLLACDFDRVIVGHGHNIETGGKRALEHAYSFL
ncbi:MAG: DUF4336 domain-containing protein [Candidatus Latescibacteria bacterium]|jgi:hypothetical protein|nr:DUF4336 domain-containing protein [Candidatus Latescibacterota bacterium]MBT4136470.1 DUF4336 domain-containing protein [Candidatus Latescibacterota bacterium]MBT5831033.1 DUF4336 domain-containing protein [Candidatus Latescibacterota bacterium]